MIFLNFKYELNSISYNDIKYENYYLYSYLQITSKLKRLSGGCSPYNIFFNHFEVLMILIFFFPIFKISYL